MHLSSETKVFGGIIAVSIAIVIGSVFFFAGQEKKKENTPVLTREQLVPPGSATRGNASASAFLVEFSDFQCPACKAFNPTVEQLYAQYKDKMMFVYRYFPLSQHPYSSQAAAAAEAAGRQGKFWEMGLSLFDKQETLSDATIDEIVKSLQLNADQFKKDVNDQAVKDVVQKGLDDGNKFGVNATPTFFLNGKQLDLTGTQDLITAVANAVK